VNILRPGSGVGGHFIANDPWFIVADGKEDARIIKAAREINNMKPAWVIGKIEKIAAEFRKSTDKKPRIACLGITYKPDVDDLRESSSFYIVQNLIEKGLDIIICEPNIRKHSNLKLSTTADAIAQADIVVFLVAHKEFRGLEIPKDKTVLDVCGINSKYGRTRLAEKN
jgi:UDP-N-acetyl-D-mannosaminuronic acid dehydrogenase